MPKESYFSAQVRKDFLTLGCFFHKLPDSIRSEETRFSPVKLFDAFVLKDGMFAAIEFKMVKGASFPFTQVRDVQVEALLNIEKAGGIAYFFLNHRYNGSNIVIVWRIKDYIKLRDIYGAEGRKSIPLQEYPKAWTVLERKNAHWELDEVIKEIEEYYGRAGELPEAEIC